MAWNLNLGQPPNDEKPNKKGMMRKRTLNRVDILEVVVFRSDTQRSFIPTNYVPESCHWN